MNLGVLPSVGGDWPIFATLSPDQPDKLIVVYNTAGTGDGRDMQSGEMLGHYGIQISVRDSDPKTGYRKADAIRATLAKDIRRATVTIESSQYSVHCFAHIGDVFDIGEEPNTGRRLFTINAVVSLRQTQ
ncbi:MAG: minor capsid protein [Opitutaceae bacterium]